MKKVSLVAAVAMLLALAVTPAAVADPGNGTGWETQTAVCDVGGEIQITGHEGLWSAGHVVLEDGTQARMLLTSQLVTLTTPDGAVIELFNLDHPGHKNQEPDLENCRFAFDTPDGRFDISLTGFVRP
jgi:hypothetical protein